MPYPIDGEGTRAFMPTAPITFWAGSSAQMIAKWNCLPTAPDASGVRKILLVIAASVSWMLLWGTLGHLKNQTIQKLAYAWLRVLHLNHSKKRIVPYSQSATSCRRRNSNRSAASCMSKLRRIRFLVCIGSNVAGIITRVTSSG